MNTKTVLIIQFISGEKKNNCDSKKVITKFCLILLLKDYI